MYKVDNTPTVLLETLYLSHPKITETPMVDIIIETPDTAKAVAQNILKTSIPPKKGYAHGEERITDCTLTKKLCLVKLI